MARPWDHGMQAWAYDPTACSGTFTPTAGVLYVVRLYIRNETPVFVANIGTLVSQAGSGATPLANCFMGIYDSSGNLLTNSGTADLSTSFQTAGFRTNAMTAAQKLTAGQNYWVGLLIGQQATTPVIFNHSAVSAAGLNANLVNSTARGGSQSSGLSALPASITPGSNSLVNPHWACVL